MQDRQLLSSSSSYRVHLSGLFILLVITSSTSVALFIGRVISYYYTNASKRQYRQIADQCSPDDAHEHETDRVDTVSNMAKYESLVHPSMTTHTNPRKVMIIESSEKVDTELTVSELMKYTSVPEVEIVEGKDDKQGRIAGCSREVGRLFDLIIVLAPEDVTDKDQLQVQSLYSCLEDEGILTLNLGDTASSYKDPNFRYTGVINELENAGYKSIHVYEDAHLTGQSFLAAFKSQSTRADWHSNEAEFNIRLHQRILKNKSLHYFDAATMLRYQIPSKAVETAYCRGAEGMRADECKEFRGINPEWSNTPVSDLSVSQSQMGEHSGRGLFANTDIQQGQLIGAEKDSLGYFFAPSTHQIIEEMIDWVEENDGESHLTKVVDSIFAVEAFQTGYGYWTKLQGRTHSTVDSGVKMFCNHGCANTFNYGEITGFTEANVNVTHPPDALFRGPSPHNPVIERNIRQYLTSYGGGRTNRIIKKGEEILCDYLKYVGDDQHWEEEVGSLRGQCDGSEVGDITYYESSRS